jgi:hypothetical protein
VNKQTFGSPKGLSLDIIGGLPMARPGSLPFNQHNPNLAYALYPLIQAIQQTSASAVANELKTSIERLAGVFGQKFKETHFQELDLLTKAAAFPTTVQFLADYTEHLQAAMSHLAEAQWNRMDLAGAKDHTFSGAQFQVNATNMSQTASTANFSMGLLNISTKHLVTLVNYSNSIVDTAYNLHKHYWLRSEGTASILSSHMLLHALAGLEVQTMALNEVVNRLQYADVYVNQVGTSEVVPEKLRKSNRSKGSAINIASNTYSISSGRVTMIDGPRLLLNSGRAPKKGPSVKALPLLPSFPKTVVLPTLPLTGIEIEDEPPFVMPYGATYKPVNKPSGEMSDALKNLPMEDEYELPSS